jgi:hypothetical protein
MPSRARRTLPDASILPVCGLPVIISALIYISPLVTQTFPWAWKSPSSKLYCWEFAVILMVCGVCLSVSSAAMAAGRARKSKIAINLVIFKITFHSNQNL